MPRRKNSSIVSQLSSFDLVSETWSIVETGDQGSGSETGGEGQAAEQQAFMQEDEDSKQRGILRRLLINGPGTCRVIDSQQFARLRIPSPTRCLKLGYVVSYLMPGYWIVTDEQWVKSNLQE
jgi:hypothetical protein